MKPRKAKTRFLKRLEAAGRSLNALTPVAGVEAMLTYYTEERADGCPLDQDGDMLLFQWGTYDWGAGPAFEVSIVRQFIVANEEDDEPRQLDLQFRFAPAAGASAGKGNCWCESPDRLPEFQRFIMGSPALEAVGNLSPESVELRFGRT
ncbi:MAG: hypothetical protein ACKV0T_30725 [Planctomycetales bacterium]